MTDIETEIAKLDSMTVGELRAYYHGQFGEETRSRHKVWLVRRIAWKLQEREYGGLSERALTRAAELADGLSFRQRRPSATTSTAQPDRVKVVELPAVDPAKALSPGTILRKEWRGKTLVVQVLPGGFRYEGEIYSSLSAVARAITGTRWNGYLFFGLKKRERRA